MITVSVLVTLTFLLKSMLLVSVAVITGIIAIASYPDEHRRFHRPILMLWIMIVIIASWIIFGPHVIHYIA